MPKRIADRFLRDGHRAEFTTSFADLDLAAHAAAVGLGEDRRHGGTVH